MIKNLEKPIVFGARQYTGIKELGIDPEHGGLTVNLYTTPPAEQRGGFFTSIPISPASHRKKYKRDNVCFRDDGKALFVWDDWGKFYIIQADREVLDLLVADLTFNDVREITR